MKKWYTYYLREIKKLGNRVFIIDEYGLLKDLNFYRELNRKYAILKYQNDGEVFKFLNDFSEKPVIVYSEFELKRSFVNKFQIINLNIADVFPDLSPNLLKEIDVSYYQEIYNYYEQIKSEGMDIGSTEDLILKSVWDVDLGHLHSLTENLKVALSVILDKKNIPQIIIDKVSTRLSEDVSALRNDTNKFLAWIRDIVFEYITSIRNQTKPKYDLDDNLIQFYLLRISMEYNLDFPFIDESVLNSKNWLSKFKSSPSKDVLIKKIKSQVEQLNLLIQNFLSKEFDLNEIDKLLVLSRLFCEIIYLIQTKDLKFEEFIDIEQTYGQLEAIFRKLVNESDNKYQSLFYYPFNKKPFTVDKILHHITNNYPKKPFALLVFDGMSYDEWFVLRNKLKYEIEEHEIFAMIPTITSFSRHAIFSGKTPDEFMAQNKASGESEFKRFLSNKGIKDDDILFGHLDLKNNCIRNKNDKIEYANIDGYSAIGCICNLFDDISHEDLITKNHKMNLYKKLDLEINSSSLLEFIDKLKQSGYTIFITSDHGNIFCQGNDIKTNKNLEFEERKSKRCLIFDKEIFVDNLVHNNPYDIFRYTHNFVPNNLIFLFPKINQCFISKGDYSITHGGISPEELIVPFVVIK